MSNYQPDWSLLNMGGHKAPIPEGAMPPAPTAANPSTPPYGPGTMALLGNVQRDLTTPSADPTNEYYKYAVLASLLGSVGAGVGQAFRPWVRPPQPLPSPQAPQMPVTAPASISALSNFHSARKGY